MRTADEVDKLIEAYKAEGLSAPEIIERIAPECIGWPYVFGAWGEECTPSGRRKRIRDDAPTIKSSCQVLRDKDRRDSCAGCKWFPGNKRVRMYDCRGFTAWLLRQVGLDLIGGGATGQFNDARNWLRRGDIAEMPNVVCCVFRKAGGKMQHTGMHIGDGRVIHCSRNVEDGGMSGWTHYGIPIGLYTEDQLPRETVKRTLRRGSQGEDVRELQLDLNARGYDCGTADGVFGKNTESAVKSFQRDNGLTADGVVGRKTWAALESPVLLYSVSISGATQAQVTQILKICPQAIAAEEGDYNGTP